MKLQPSTSHFHPICMQPGICPRTFLQVWLIRKHQFQLRHGGKELFRIWTHFSLGVHTAREICISSSVGEDGPQRLPWTAATGPITTAGVWRRKNLQRTALTRAFVKSPSSMFYIWNVTSSFLRVCVVYISVSQQQGFLFAGCVSAAGVYRRVCLVFARTEWERGI